MQIDPDLPLRRHPDFTVTGTSLMHEVATAPGCAQVRSRYATRVLAAFATPATLRQVSDELAAQLPTSAAWMAATQCIRDCYRAGILSAVSAPQPPSSAVGFAQESQHILMLNDAARTEPFIAALRAEVKPNDVVVDIGTGTGILAMAAAKCGAAKVYAVEQSAMADVAEAGFKANGLSDTVTLIRGRSTAITLPEKATLVVAEVIGDDLFDEGILEILADAKARLATTDARFIPRSIGPVLVPVQLPHEVLAKSLYTQPVVADWTRRYDVNFEWLLQPAQRSPGVTREQKLSVVRNYRCGPSLPMPQVMLGSEDRWYQESIPWPGFADANAIAIAFDCHLTDSITLGTDPSDNSEVTSWAVPVWIPMDNRLGQSGTVTVTSTPTRTRVRFTPS